MVCSVVTVDEDVLGAVDGSDVVAVVCCTVVDVVVDWAGSDVWVVEGAVDEVVVDVVVASVVSGVDEVELDDVDADVDAVDGASLVTVAPAGARVGSGESPAEISKGSASAGAEPLCNGSVSNPVASLLWSPAKVRPASPLPPGSIPAMATPRTIARRQATATVAKATNRSTARRRLTAQHHPATGKSSSHQQRRGKLGQWRWRS